MIVSSMTAICFVSIRITPSCTETSSNPNKLSFQNFSSKSKIFSIHNSIEPTPNTCAKSKTCECFDLYNELVPYAEAWAWQKSIVKEKKQLIERKQECPDTLIVLQHYPVYTLGTASSKEYLNFDVNDSPFDIYRTERGGEVTYHGPGQLVMYPIINLRNHRMDLHWYLRALEEVVIRVLSSTFAFEASQVEGLTGVWVGDQKLAAIGIRVQNWIAYHGLALNVTTDLAPFQKIVPCGIRDRAVGSIKGLLEARSSDRSRAIELSELDDSELMDVVHGSILKEFSEVFELQLEFSNKKSPASDSRILDITNVQQRPGAYH